MFKQFDFYISKCSLLSIHFPNCILFLKLCNFGQSVNLPCECDVNIVVDVVVKENDKGDQPKYKKTTNVQCIKKDSALGVELGNHICIKKVIH